MGDEGPMEQMGWLKGSPPGRRGLEKPEAAPSRKEDNNGSGFHFPSLTTGSEGLGEHTVGVLVISTLGDSVTLPLES